jgi:hypothetical protein
LGLCYNQPALLGYGGPEVGLIIEHDVAFVNNNAIKPIA